jgi:hypothetical protein
MKTKLIIILLLLWAGVVWGQNTRKELTTVKELVDFLKDNDKSISNDIYNPINFCTITERMPKTNGRNTIYTLILAAGQDYVKKGSQIYLDFDKNFVDVLGKDCDVQVLAYIQRKDKTIKPISVLGFTTVNAIQNDKVGVMKSGESINSADVQYIYKVTRERGNGKSYSGELNIVWEDVAEEDKIIIQVTNTAKNNTGFTMTLIYDDFGWKQNPTGGFSFVKIAEKGFTEFSPAASIGYSFRYQPRKSSSFLGHFFSPSFGPMVHVFQNGNDTTIGAGLFLSSFYNMVSFGGGWTINGTNHGKPYFSLGLNFIESYNTITSLL